MNIWIFNHYAIAPGASGGTRHYDLARELVKRNYNVTIFASSFSHQERKERYIPEPGMKWKEETYNGVRFVWIKTPEYKRNDWRRVANMLSYTVQSYMLGKKRNEKPDLIIGTLMHPLAALVGCMLARKYKCTFYFEERDLWPQTLIDLGKVSRGNPVVWLLRKLEHFLYRNARRIIVLFDKADQYVAGQGFDIEKVVYLPNGADLARYNQDTLLANDLEQVFASLEGKLVVTYTGAHGIANHLDPILDAAGILKDRDNSIHFVMVGDGPEKQRLVERSRQEKLTNITFVPPVKKEDIPAILLRSDVGVISMQDAEIYKWGFSLNKMYDYMAASLPIVLLCQLEETPIEMSGAGMKVNNSQQMAESLQFLALNRTALRQMGKKGRAYVENNHAWKQLAYRLMNVIEKDIPIHDVNAVSVQAVRTLSKNERKEYNA
ncbi:glycosyltransferase family 4 protein [Aneurinibacillus aneurinilyticus]|uniref:Glycosyltransferase, group 1 family protein n=1 Tax=Aneurinibacillus aneurinilyticus ATCC 12856 TaxID=649747 RepID=U1Y4D0_ANEAE|nr:glycosyltransferase family 4 protein [Aneurinibacillus aneurinilyticus]ERI07042.1 glycosyltransferase, group 1 family protein [Aneurinibacillus aneurinilyticus ATCC 12856]MED0706416.1 glycosyltransferase family 4 protein [Aneurinibacillus aneurinilyticus]MED0723690.1 glycosyltransferase family 4 protein [Aneurinibacillus aneurinilyticus]MED0730628.1 glycosyltransferase family 4 protein [Aneurinibacillus aneurinilyticus]MED0741042.1 glycosyltransferase family 4 protein [Aneurinibacillus aneu